MKLALPMPAGIPVVPAVLHALRKTGRAIAIAARAVVNFWNIPPLGEADPRRSLLQRHNWYI